MDLHELELKASRLEELPEFLSLPQSELYLSLRSLYAQYRRGYLDKEQAAREKKYLIKSYEYSSQRYEDYANLFCRYQENMRQVEELIHQLNHALKERPIDREKALRLLCRIVDRTYGMTSYEEKLFGRGEQHENH